MESSVYSYGLMAIICAFIIMNDARKRVFGKSDILYRVKDKRKVRYVYFALGLSIPVVLILAGVMLDHDILTRIIIVILSIEMAVLWGLIELADGLITKEYSGKVWFTKFSLVEFYSFMNYKGREHLLFKKTTSKRQEMLPINPEDKGPIIEILKSLNLKSQAEALKTQHKNK